MLKSAMAAVLLVLAGAGQDQAKINGLVQRLDDPDWVEQAKAAKDLVAMGRTVFDGLRSATLSESTAKRYWANVIVEEIYRREKGGAAPVAPTPAPATPPADTGSSEPAAMNFGQGENDLGSIMFICNNTKHGDYEVVLSRCPNCAKAKRFTIDYKIPGKGFRCTVCGKQYVDFKCDQCGVPPGPKTRVKLKR